VETASSRDGQSVPSTLQALQSALGAHYVLEGELGRGGMATVYRARDVRHDRPVAVKVLHPELAAVMGAQRFLAEIHTTAALQHPHILPLFDSGNVDGLLYYVMPYVAGETLRGRLTRERQLPVDEALRITREVASALDYAHRHGVIHRDVKPENVLLDEEGRALVADFGIALAVSHAAGERLTQSGLSLGTPQYMAPEQAAGEHAVDARADVYALGAVLYEMLAGQPPFTGASAQAVIAKLMTEAPPALTRERRSVPPHVEAVVTRALEKLPADRFPSASAFAAALAEPVVTSSLVRPGIRRLPRLSLVGAALVATGALVAGVAFGVILDRTALQSSPRDTWRFIIEPDSGYLGSGFGFGTQRSGPAVISPDGHTVVFRASGTGGPRLYVRRLDELTEHSLAGTEDGDWPLFSPDGAWVAFYSNGSLQKIRLTGGAPVPIAQLSSGAYFRGGSWAQDDTIFFADEAGALYRVAAAGGVVSRVALADTALRFLSPQALPGGRALLVAVTPDLIQGRIGVVDRVSGQVRQFGPGVAPHYVRGQIVYSTYNGELYRQPFALDRLDTSGAAERIASGVDFGAAFDVSPAGALVYRLSSLRNPDSTTLVVMDRAGHAQRVFSIREVWTPRFAADGRRVVHGGLAPGHDSGDVWITDIVAGTRQRVTADAKDGNDAQWSPDGRSIAYTVNAPGGKDIVVQALDGGRVRHFPRPGTQWTSDWVRDGNVLLFTDVPATGERAGDEDIWVQPLDGTPPRPYLTEPGHQVGARASPNGHWVAYMSDETGHFEVYVQSYPTPGSKTVISAGGGVHPIWSPDGRTLYYWQSDQLVAARLDFGAAGTAPLVRGRTPVLRASYIAGANANYDVSPDGSRFVIVTGPPRANRLVVALNALK